MAPAMEAKEGTDGSGIAAVVGGEAVTAEMPEDVRKIEKPPPKRTRSRKTGKVALAVETTPASDGPLPAETTGDLTEKEGEPAKAPRRKRRSPGRASQRRKQAAAPSETPEAGGEIPPGKEIPSGFPDTGDETPPEAAGP